MVTQTKKEVKRMNRKGGVSALKDACRRNTLNRILEKYIKSCRSPRSDDGSEPSSTKRPQVKTCGRFPNIAGFCRFYHISIDELDELSLDFPQEIAHLYAILEDEALNSGLPPAVLSAYLKKRLGYDKESPSSEPSGQLNIRFEHDIFNDGG